MADFITKKGHVALMVEGFRVDNRRWARDPIKKLRIPRRVLLINFLEENVLSSKNLQELEHGLNRYKEYRESL
jgi:hypothetical protein